MVLKIGGIGPNTDWEFHCEQEIDVDESLADGGDLKVFEQIASTLKQIGWCEVPIVCRLGDYEFTTWDDGMNLLFGYPNGAYAAAGFIYAKVYSYLNVKARTGYMHVSKDYANAVEVKGVLSQNFRPRKLVDRFSDFLDSLQLEVAKSCKTRKDFDALLQERGFKDCATEKDYVALLQKYDLDYAEEQNLEMAVAASIDKVNSF